MGFVGSFWGRAKSGHKTPDTAEAGLVDPTTSNGKPRRGRGSVEFVNLTKAYETNSDHPKFVLSACNALFPAGRKVALLGRNGTGKSTVLRMISGAQDYDSGEIVRVGKVSWPIGFGGAFHPDLTGAQNTRFIARVHGVDTDHLMTFVHEFAELEDFFFLPVRTYSSGMRARLAFAVSMGVPFDCYLMDEVTSVGDQRFKEKCADAIATRLKGATAILATHSLGQAAKLCDMGAVLNHGTMELYESVDEAISVHQHNLKSL